MHANDHILLDTWDETRVERLETLKENRTHVLMIFGHFGEQIDVRNASNASEMLLFISFPSSTYTPADIVFHNTFLDTWAP